MLQTPINVDPSNGQVKTVGTTVTLGFTFQGDLLTFVQGEVVDMEYYGNPSSGTNQWVVWYNMPTGGHLSTIHNGQRVTYTDSNGWMATWMKEGHNYKHRIRQFQHYPEGMTTTSGGSTVSIAGTPMPDMYYARGKITKSTGNYSNTRAYNPGDVCKSSNVTYACNTKITKNEEDQYNSDGSSFNSAHWTQVNNYQTVIEPNLENIKAPFYYSWTDDESVQHQILLGAIYVDILYERHMISAYDKTTGIVTFQKVTFDPNTTEYTAQEVLNIANDTSLTTKFSVDEYRPYKMYTNYLETGWYDFKWRDKPDITTEIITDVPRSTSSSAQREAVRVGISCEGTYSHKEAVGLKWYQYHLYAVNAETYSNERTYALGDLCVYNNTLYRCIIPVTTPSDFESHRWAVADPDEYGTLVDESDRTFSYNLQTGFPVHPFTYGYVSKLTLSTQENDVESVTAAEGKYPVDEEEVFEFTPTNINGKTYYINDNTKTIEITDSVVRLNWTAVKNYFFDVFRREVYSNGTVAPFAYYVGRATSTSVIGSISPYSIVDYSVANNKTYQYEFIVKDDRNTNYGKPYNCVYVYNVRIKWSGWHIFSLTPQEDNTNRKYMQIGDEWKFISAIDSGDITRNINSVLHVGTSAYAMTSRNHNKYESGSFTADLLSVDCPSHEIVDNIERVNAWMDFICGDNPFLLKSNKGDVWVVNIVNSPSRQYEETFDPIFTKVHYEWAESANKDKCVFV